MSISNPSSGITTTPTTGLSDPPGSLTRNGQPAGPRARNVAFTGTLEVGETVTGSYTYSGPLPESGTTFKWYRDGVAIVGATSTTYLLDAADDGAYITFGVTPSDGVNTGPERISAAQGPVGGLPDSALFLRSAAQKGGAPETLYLRTIAEKA